ncbi:hypothetical protein [Reyranella sp.]|uniref:hypothetical protein n=1 Tax=Reyranella sp. TaxID=1929291 RepID=UPI002725C4B5|nr:hypothetical protein [Reyranella sp.]MDO8976750.1 hypothetical protein [Reyranella sp.]
MADLEELQADRPIKPRRILSAERRALSRENVARANLQIAGALYIVQRGQCFHCGGALPLFAGRRRDFACSREHALPQERRTGRPQHDNAFVLAHALCNHDRASRPFSITEWARAAELWESARRLWIGSSNPFPAWIDLANEKLKEST